MKAAFYAAQQAANTSPTTATGTNTNTGGTNTSGGTTNTGSTTSTTTPPAAAGDPCLPIEDFIKKSLETSATFLEYKTLFNCINLCGLDDGACKDKCALALVDETVKKIFNCRKQNNVSPLPAVCKALFDKLGPNA